MMQPGGVGKLVRPNSWGLFGTTGGPPEMDGLGGRLGRHSSAPGPAWKRGRSVPAKGRPRDDARKRLGKATSGLWHSTSPVAFRRNWQPADKRRRHAQVAHADSVASRHAPAVFPAGHCCAATEPAAFSRWVKLSAVSGFSSLRGRAPSQQES
ncbi:hypothetical protein MTO96_006639 [Rhipicephalus appendiculatus]